MHPVVPGAPVVDLEVVQYSMDVPHWLLLLQHALRGQGLRSANRLPEGGGDVPGTSGPHFAYSFATGRGGLPGLKHMV
jgi:hypothetical protein